MLLLIASLVGGCAVRAVDPATLLPVKPAAVVRLDDGAAAAALARDGRIEVWVARREGGEVRVQSIAGSGGAVPLLEDRVHLASHGGDTGQAWSTLVYGTAEPGTARVQLDGFEGLGGQVVDGAWLIVLREKDVTSAQLHWRFLGSDGSVRREGSGLRTCTTAAPCPTGSR